MVGVETEVPEGQRLDPLETNETVAPGAVSMLYLPANQARRSTSEPLAEEVGWTAL
jgi:hypothetical protein